LLHQRKKTTGVIRGVLIDTTGKLHWLGATVSVIFNKDSTMASFTLSDKTGMFEIKDLADDSYKLHVSFKGLEPYQKSFSITPAKQVIDLGKIIMKKIRTHWILLL